MDIQSGFLKEEYFTTWDYNYQSEVHSRILGLIIRICHELEFDVEIERGFNYKQAERTIRFRPDVSVYKDNRLKAFIEYESTNSSDARFYDINRETSDLRCIKLFGSDPSNDIPELWIVIFTLPKGEVEKKKWDSWEMNKSNKKFLELVASPYDFYFPKYIKEATNVYGSFKISSDLYLLNIDRSKLRIEKRIKRSALLS